MLSETPLATVARPAETAHPYAVRKRILDLSICLILAPLALLAMAAIALAILIDSGRPIFFVQERVGRGGKRFRLYKFRTLVPGYDDPAGREYMRAFVRGLVGNDKPGREWVHKPIEKRAMSRVGRLLRKSSLDELPQLLNVLRGHMRFVGPRPERPEFVAELEKAIPFYSFRHSVKPGLTGWAQINYPYGASVEDARRKLEYDLYYVKHHNFLFDLTILLRTVEVVLMGKGAR